MKYFILWKLLVTNEFLDSTISLKTHYKFISFQNFKIRESTSFLWRYLYCEKNEIPLWITNKKKKARNCPLIHQ